MMTGNLMGQSIPPLRRWRKHQPLDHRQLNEPVEAINRMITGVGVPRQMMARVGGGEAIGTVSASFRLKQSGIWRGDYLWCRTWDADTETEGDEDVFVAKPWLLRRSPFEGAVREGIEYTYTGNVSRTARRIGTSKTEKQAIVDVYAIGDVITATSPIKGGMGVIVGEVPLVWLARTEGRAWARIFDQS